MTWLLLQLADGSFPSGGFAHSGGLEAALVLGAGQLDIGAFLDATLHQTANAALPFVRAAQAAPEALAEHDAACDASLPLLGPNAASRAQGRAFLGAVRRIWPDLGLASQYMHHAPVFGAVFGQHGMTGSDASAAWLHGTARTVLSAAVRLGVLGPLEAQSILAERAPLLERLLGQVPRPVAHTAPLLEMFGAVHARLDGRMFQS